jgi:hypothetical protein
MGWTAEVLFPAGVRDFSVLHGAQIGSGAHLVSYPMDVRKPFPGGKAAGP